MTKSGFDGHNKSNVFLSIFNSLQNFGFIVGVLVILIVLNTDNMIASFINLKAKNIVLSIYNTIYQPIDGLGNGLSAMSRYVQIMDDNSRLEQENIMLKQQVRIAELQASHAATLEKLLNVVQHKRPYFYTAKVVLKIFNSYDVSLIVNLGTSDGIKQNMVVFSEDGLIGRVTEVFDNFAKIMTIADPKSRIPVVFQESGQIAVASGTGHTDGMLELLHVQDISKIVNFETVTSSGLGGIFQPGIVLGKVKRDERGVHIETAMNYYKLHYVLISTS